MGYENRRARIASEIRAELARQKISQSALSIAVGITPNTLRRRLDGVRPFYIDELDSISHYLGITLADLVARSDEANV